MSAFIGMNGLWATIKKRGLSFPEKEKAQACQIKNTSVFDLAFKIDRGFLSYFRIETSKPSLHGDEKEG